LNREFFEIGKRRPPRRTVRTIQLLGQIFSDAIEVELLALDLGTRAGFACHP